MQSPSDAVSSNSLHRLNRWYFSKIGAIVRGILAFVMSLVVARAFMKGYFHAPSLGALFWVTNATIATVALILKPEVVMTMIFIAIGSLVGFLLTSTFEGTILMAALIVAIAIAGNKT